MKIRSLGLATMAGSLFIAGAAQAQFLGIEMQLHSSQEVTGTGPSAGYGPTNTYHVYATFESSAAITGVLGARLDRIDNEGNIIADGKFFKQKVPSYHGAFHNLFGPTAAQLSGPNAAGFAVDTYATIGWPLAGSQSPPLGFSQNAGMRSGGGYGGQGEVIDGAFISNWESNWSSGESEGWFSSNPTDPARVAVQGDDGVYRVLLWQITVGEDEYFQGHVETIGVVGVGFITAGLNPRFNYAFTNAPGACCIGDRCNITMHMECEGAFLGAFTDCEGNPCLPPPPTGACCLAGSCVVTTHANCGGLYLGNNTTCHSGNINMCSQVGACCSQTGGCTLNTDGGCAGLFLGPGTTCFGSPCNNPETGVCCTGTSCATKAPGNCSGAYLGPGASCTNSPCAQGACCEDERCTVLPKWQCEGEFLGDNTSCAGNPCAPPPPPPTGACCTDLECSITTQADCAGEYIGDDTTCDDDPCAPATGACCTNFTCSITTEDDCGGEYLGDDTTCDGDPCAPPPPTGACCVNFSCSITTEASCAGAYLGDDTTCAGNPCAPPAPPLLGVDYELHATWTHPESGVAYETYRVYAYFDEAEVHLTGVINAWMTHLNPDGTVGPGDVFFNQTTLDEEHQNIPPTAGQINNIPLMAFDTFATVGFWVRDPSGNFGPPTPSIAFTPGFGQRGSGGYGGNQFLGNWDRGQGEAWFVNGNTQNFSAHTQSSAENDYKVGVFQFTIEAGEFFAGEFGVGTVEHGTLIPSFPASLDPAIFHFTNWAPPPPAPPLFIPFENGVIAAKPFNSFVHHVNGQEVQAAFEAAGVRVYAISVLFDTPFGYNLREVFGSAKHPFLLATNGFIHNTDHSGGDWYSPLPSENAANPANAFDSWIYLGMTPTPTLFGQFDPFDPDYLGFFGNLDRTGVFGTMNGGWGGDFFGLSGGLIMQIAYDRNHSVDVQFNLKYDNFSKKRQMVVPISFTLPSVHDE